MAKVTPYYSVNEAKKPTDKQVHHDNDQCRAGRDIPQRAPRFCLRYLASKAQVGLYRQA